MNDSNSSAQRQSALTATPLSDAPCCASSILPECDLTESLDRQTSGDEKGLMGKAANTQEAGQSEDCPSPREEFPYAETVQFACIGAPLPSDLKEGYDVLSVQKTQGSYGSGDERYVIIQAKKDSAQRPSALTGDSPLSDATCCVSSEVLKLREARAKFESAPKTGESVAEYLIAAAQSLQTFAQAFGPALLISPGQTIEEFLDQLQPCTDG
jgi:hypothetical protein